MQNACNVHLHANFISKQQKSNIRKYTRNAIMESKSMSLISFVMIVVVLLQGSNISSATRVFTMINHCTETIWPAVTPGDNFNGGGFMLKPGQSMVFNAPATWSGRIWGRTGCKFDQDGNGKCLTGACGTSLQCKAGGEPPATLAEFTLASSLSPKDFYDVSLVDGFNLPIAVKPLHGTGNCTIAGCDSDLRKNCPKELAVKSGGKNVACKSACEAFDTDEYCCKGMYGNPSTCRPTYYSRLFKAACPTSYSYAYDDPTSIFTCTAPDYIITFCSSRSQPVCTYHNNKLICSGSNGFNSSFSIWLSVMVVISMMIISHLS